MHSFANIRTTPQHNAQFTLWGIAAALWMLVPSSAMGHSLAVDVLAEPSHLQPVQWNVPFTTGVTPEQLMFALRKRALSTTHNPECTSLHHQVQRLRRARPEHQAQAQVDLAQAQQRQKELRCPQTPKT